MERDNSIDYGTTAEDLSNAYAGPNGTWGEHPYYTRADWRQEVENDDTILGYWAWVEARLVEEECDGNSTG